MAPGPPWKSVSPVKTQPRAGAWKRTRPALCPGVCSTRSAVPATAIGLRRRRGRRRAGCPGGPAPTARRSSGCSRIGAPVARPSAGATRTWSSWAWVHSDRRPPGGRRRPRRTAATSCGASITTHSPSSPTTQTLLSTSKVCAVEGERAAGDGVVDAGGHEKTTTERSTSPWCIFSNAASTSSERDLLGDERVEVEPALLVELDQHREVAAGQAVAVPAGLQRAAAAEDVDQRQVDLHVRGGHADQHHRAGQVAGVERLLPGLRAADRVDHHVGAEAAGERRGSPRPGRPRTALTVCVAPNSARPVELAVVDVDRDDRGRAGQARRRRSRRRRRRRSRSRRRCRRGRPCRC